MYPGRITWARLVIAIALVGLTLVATASAQNNPDEDTPFYDVPVIPARSPWPQWLIGAGFVGGCVVIALKNPHRTHLD